MVVSMAGIGFTNFDDEIGGYVGIRFFEDGRKSPPRGLRSE